MTQSYVVPFSFGGESITAKRFLCSQGVSLSRWRSIKHSGTFAVNGVPCIAARTMLKAGDEVSFSLPEPSPGFAAENLPLDILFEDEYFLIINKPPNMLVHPVRQEQTGTVGNAVLGYYARTGKPYGFHPVHRLDRDTSGVLLIAKTPEAQHVMSTKDGKKFSREYLALARGKPEPPQQTINAPIARIEGVRHGVCENGKTAITHCQTLGFGNGLSLLRLKLDTGRTHQIRVHLAHIGTPLLGDSLYGTGNDPVPRQMLHAERVAFLHPFTARQISITAPIPNDMHEILDLFVRVF